mmetsp:Transcript_40576/g.46543  ORF Transcript_40576/g.46543 Transcript_40576/m.46543 type:complete len:109 (-) Transcript_40576:51-377(-)|eukprot:CAMPEP_0168322260 /NCGR_PEP_ID=MMETSP0213-20121227/2781_1 /TAXON_ID=151035 /ORGANISM="Euplotes harpa, Strain FSP1.4" /LENGTH=108 /DNA_ID=CAMNT_0008324109 /DNA_START=245 /DNA_END=571 /DNA_ORIENTATION=-
MDSMTTATLYLCNKDDEKGLKAFLSHYYLVAELPTETIVFSWEATGMNCYSREHKGTVEGETKKLIGTFCVGKLVKAAKKCSHSAYNLVNNNCQKWAEKVKSYISSSK